MSYVAIGVAGVSLVTGIITSSSANKKKKKAEREIKKQKAEQAKELQKGVDAKMRTEKDLANEYAGQAVISPETQYARNLSERGTASAIDKAMRSGSSNTEIMNMVSGLTARGQLEGQKISASEAERRKRAMVASKGAAINAAETGLAGTQAQIGLQDQAYAMTMQKQQQINEAAAQNNAYYSGMAADIGAAYAYNNTNNKLKTTPRTGIYD
jgi:hypothetical protein